MYDLYNLSDVKWECKYHVVIILRYRIKVLYGRMRRKIGEVLCELVSNVEWFYWKEAQDHNMSICI